LQRAVGADAVAEGKVGVFFFRPAYEIEPHAPVVLALSAAGQRVLGAPLRVIGLSPWMDSAILGTAGIPTVIFGPSGAGAHAAEEYVDVKSVVRCAQVLAETAVQFCGAR